MVPETVINNPVSNAFDLLKEGQRKLLLESIKYPDKEVSEKNLRGNFRLYNDIIDLMKKNQHGFTQGCDLTFDKDLVKAMCDGLFYIFPNLHRFK